MLKGKTPVGSRLLTVEDAASELALSTHTIRAWIAHRRIAFVRLGGAVRISSDEIKRLISSGTTEPVGTSTQK